MRVGCAADRGGTITRTPLWRQPRIAPPRASTRNETRNLCVYVAACECVVFVIVCRECVCSLCVLARFILVLVSKRGRKGGGFRLMFSWVKDTNVCKGGHHEILAQGARRCTQTLRNNDNFGHFEAFLKPKNKCVNIL